MNYEEVETRFGTYDCLRLPKNAHLILNNAPILEEVQTDEPIHFPPPWDPSRQSTVDRFHATLPEQAFLEYHRLLLAESGIEANPDSLQLTTFQTLSQELHLPESLRSSWLQHLNSDYTIILQLGGLIYDLCRIVRRAGKAGIVGVHQGLKNYFEDQSLVTEAEWEILLTLTQLYYEVTALLQNSPRHIAHLIASQTTVSRIDLFWILQAIGIAYEGSLFLRRFELVRWHLDLILGRLQIPRQVSRRVEIYRMSSGPGRSPRVIPLTPKNLAILIEDPVSSFAWPVEFGRFDYTYLTGRSMTDLRRELLELLMDRSETGPPKTNSAHNEIYDWYRRAGMNRLSRDSINDLILRLARYPRTSWDSERITMTIRRLSSPSYNLDDFINDYDRDHIEELTRKKEAQFVRFREHLAPFYPTSQEASTDDGAFLIPLLSPRGLLLFYSIVGGWVPVWFDRLIAKSITSVVPSTREFPGLYGNRYGIDGILLPEVDRVLLITE